MLKANAPQPSIGRLVDDVMAAIERDNLPFKGMLAKMDISIRGIGEQIAQGDTFHDDRFPDLKADYILANQPFNVKDWGGEQRT